ncbi:hypothetical protein QTG54_010261 [Skeletonema marinoi]|uniref:Uncharacterized protein n=1 Tax=Skeletonema marinoi TaxID=267567 RepID=A0AAD9DAR5_9STRA|nr:hypothetical protein QTG54_010261 [Skeletonema marinoi]
MARIAESQICLNGTNIEKSLASYDIFHWLEEDERRELHGDYELLSMELLAEIHVKKPGGELHTLDVETGAMSYVNEITARAIKWPNEVASIPRQQYVMNHHPTNSSSTTFASSNGEQLEDALLVTDGFLVPGKDKGGLYVVQNPTNTVWMDMTGDGRQSILAARAKLPLLQGNSQDDNGTLGKGQLVWLERPMPHTFDVRTGTPLDVDGTVFDPFRPSNTPWKLRILDEGPDVMFSVADLDPQDDTIEVIASQFFSKKLSLHSIKLGLEPKVTFRRVIDDRCGAAFSSVLADLDGLTTMQQADAAHYPMVVDSGSTVVSLNSNDAFSHLLVTSHECSYADSSGETMNIMLLLLTRKTLRAKSQLALMVAHQCRVPHNPKLMVAHYLLTAYQLERRLEDKTMDSFGDSHRFQGAPGFVYSFFPTREGGIGSDKKWHRPLIGLSGDCAESAYILRPIEEDTIEVGEDRSTKYALILAVGYDDFYTTVAEQQSGYAKIYVPCYEQDKVLVFALGSGEDEDVMEDGW